MNPCCLCSQRQDYIPHMVQRLLMYKDCRCSALRFKSSHITLQLMSQHTDCS